MAEQCCNVPAAAQHAKDHYVLALKPVEDEVLADGKRPQAGAQVLVASPP